MSDKITVDNIPNVSLLGEKAKSAGDSFREETEAAYQTFQLKTDGQNGAALESFLQELNMLSTQVFHVFPGVLTNFGSTVENYASSLEGEGFSTGVYTDAGDISLVKTWLTTQRSKSVTEKGDALDKAIADVKDVLSKDPAPKDIGEVNSNSVVETAVTDLSDHSTKYQNKHDNLIDAKTTFVQGLDTAITDLDSAKGYLARASNLQYTDPNYLIKWLADGKLTKSNMTDLYLIQDTKDGEMLNVLYYEGKDKEKFFRDLGSVDGSHVSQGMMNKAYNRVIVEYNGAYNGNADNLANINTFVQAVTGQVQNSASEYLKKLVTSGDIYAATLTASAKALVPPLPDSNASEEEFQKYNERMAEIQDDLAAINGKMVPAGSLSSLFETLYGVRAGKGVDQEVSIGDISIGKGKTVSFAVTTLTYENHQQTTEKLTINPSGNTQGLNEAEAVQRIDDLRAQREDAVEDFMTSTVLTGVDIFVPGGSELVSAIETASSFSGTPQEIVDLSSSQAGEMTDSKSGKMTASTSGNLINLILDVNETNQEIKDAKGVVEAEMFDSGGYYIAGSDDYDGSQFQLNYDLQSQLQMDDLEKNGLRGYTYRNNGGMSGDLSHGIGAVQAFENSYTESVSGNKKAYQLLADKGDVKLSDVDVIEVRDEMKGISENKDRKNYNEGNYESFLYEDAQTGEKGYKSKSSDYFNDLITAKEE